MNNDSKTLSGSKRILSDSNRTLHPSKLYVYLFRSRNKDNKDVPNFKERSKTVLEYESDEETVLSLYKEFVEQGVSGEHSRLYKSVNARNEEAIREKLTIRLIRNKPPVPCISRTLASVALKSECRAESKWLFDFDVDDELLMNDFVHEIVMYSEIPLLEIKVHKTPHGYAVIVPHGFDTRKLMEKWKDYDITLKRDDLLFLDMQTKL